jgi:hypothetical protein
MHSVAAACRHQGRDIWRLLITNLINVLPCAGFENPHASFPRQQRLDIAPVHVVLACGVFGNIALAHAQASIATLPSVLTQPGVVISSRGRNDDGADPSEHVRELSPSTASPHQTMRDPEPAFTASRPHRRTLRSCGQPSARSGRSRQQWCACRARG